MTTLMSSVPALAGSDLGDVDRLRLAVAAYLARFKGDSRIHAESDLRVFLTWCAGHRLAPLAVGRVHVELYVRWLQEVRRFKSSTVSWRVSVVAGFCRTGVVDGILEHSPAEYVRRPAVPAESPTLGLTHLQWRRCSPQRGSQTTGSTTPWSRCSDCWVYRSSKPPGWTSGILARSTTTACCG